MRRSSPETGGCRSGEEGWPHPYRVRVRTDTATVTFQPGRGCDTATVTQAQRSPGFDSVAVWQQGCGEARMACQDVEVGDAFDLEDFDRYVEENGISEEDYPAAFAQSARWVCGWRFHLRDGALSSRGCSR